MNVVDSLIVTLGIDATGVKQGAKDATATTAKMSKDMVDAADKAEEGHNAALALIVKGLQSLGATQKKTADESVKHSKAMSEATESVAQTGEKALRTFGALFLLFAGAHSVKSFVSDMLNLDAATGRLAHNTGSTTEVISGIGRAAERAGGSFEGAVGGLRSLSDAYQQLRTTGQSGIMEPLARLQGLSGKQVTFGSDVHKNLLSIADALQVLDKRDPAQADFLGRQILGDETLTNIAKGGSAGVRAAEAQSPKITKDQAEAAQKLQAQLASVRQGFQDIGNSILMDFGPAMLKGIGWVKDLIENNRTLIETKVKEWVQEVGQWFDAHKADVEAFGAALGNIATAAGSLATAFSAQSPMMQALELFAATMGGRVLGAIGLVRGAMTALGGMPIPAALGGALGLPLLGTAAVGAVLASGDPNKALLDGGRPDVQPQDNDLGLPGVGEDRRTDTSDAKAKTAEAGSLWDKFKKAIGWGDRLQADPQTKENLDDISKATKETRDILKAQADAAGGMAGGDTAGGAMGAAHRALGWAGRAVGYSPASGGGTTPAKGALAANQKEAYAAALKEGLSATAARALVANMSGEGLAGDAHRVHWDGTHNSGGIVQWDPTRSAAIKSRFGKFPWEMSIADQTKAAIWEIQSNPRFAPTARALKGDNAADMIGALVDNYESPANRARAKAQRMGYYRGFNPGDGIGAAPKEPTVFVNGTPSSSGPVGDQAALDAQNRIIAGKGRPGDRGLIDRHRQEQNTPAPSDRNPDGSLALAARTLGRYIGVTRPMAAAGQMPHPHEIGPYHGPSKVEVVKSNLDAAHQKLADAMHATAEKPVPTMDHAIRHIMQAMAHANRLTHHGDQPMPPVTGDKTVDHLSRSRAHAHAASLARLTRMADAGRYSHTVSTVNHSSETRIGSIAVHTAATDARGIAADIEPHLHRGQDAGVADYGLG